MENKPENEPNDFTIICLHASNNNNNTYTLVSFIVQVSTNKVLKALKTGFWDKIIWNYE